MFSICGPIYLSFDTYECPLPSLILANQNSVPNVPPKLPKQRSIAVSAMTFSCKHRHVVFTIAEELRYFLKDITHFLIFFSSHLEISSMPWEMMINTGKTKERKTLVLLNLLIFIRILPTMWSLVPFLHSILLEYRSISIFTFICSFVKKLTFKLMI